MEPMETELTTELTDGEQVRLNVGGRLFVTTRTTLTTRLEECRYFRALLADPLAQGTIFVDRDGSSFHLILNWLRSGVLVESRRDKLLGLQVEVSGYMRRHCIFPDLPSPFRLSYEEVPVLRAEPLGLHTAAECGAGWPGGVLWAGRSA